MPHWLILALIIGAATAGVIGILHFALWRYQLGQDYARPVSYVIGVGVLTAGFAVWVGLAAAPGEVLVAWGLLVGLSGAVDLGGWAWHRWQARTGAADITALAEDLPHAD